MNQEERSEGITLFYKFKDLLDAEFLYKWLKDQ